jgi:hypothetical protein
LLTPKEIRAQLISLDDFLNNEKTLNSELEEALGHLVELNKLKKEISELYDSYSSKMIDRMESVNEKEVKLQSGAELKCKSGAPRKAWDSENLMKTVYSRLRQSSVDMDTGEVGLSDEEIVIKLLDYLQPSYWRVGALNELGINADQYCEVGEPKTNIAIYTKDEK